MTSTVTAAAEPDLVAGFDHVAFVDPPFDGGLFGAILAAVAPHALVHVLWGESEVHFTRAVVADAYDLDAACRRVYRALAAQGSGFAAGPDEGVSPASQAGAGAAATPVPDRGLDADLLDRDGALVELPVLAAAWRTLIEAGLVADEPGKKGVNRAEGKVDLAVSDTYRTWRERFHTTTFLQRCLSIRL
ncbi:MAG: hypothetical protein ACXWIG_18010 [Caldimonas sp.]